MAFKKTFVLLFFLSSFTTYGQQVVIKGQVTEELSKQPLQGVKVSLSTPKKEGVTDKAGFYSFTIDPADSVEISFSLIGFTSVTKKVPATEDFSLDVVLSTEDYYLDEVVLEGQKQKKISEGAEISSIDLPVEQIKSIPTLFGEKDVLKALQLMPGVQTGSEGMAGLYVRGGGPGENLFLVDHAMVYNPYHLFGFFSSFNGDALQNVNLIKGGFPARYGSRLSSVINMELKSGNPERITGEAGIGLIASRFTLEGPIVKDKLTFMISGRRTYLDVLTRPFMTGDFRAGYYFYDLAGKISYKVDPKNTIYLSGYNGNDRFSISTQFEDNQSKGNLGWRNQAYTLGWDRIINKRVFSQTALTYSGYNFNIRSEDNWGGETFFLNFNSLVSEISVKQQFEYFHSDKHKLFAGISLTHHTLNPEALVFQGSYINSDLDFSSRTRALETAIFIEDEFRPFRALTINGGIRLSSFYVNGEHYINPEPRLTAGYQLKPDLSIKAGYAEMNQFAHQLTSGGIGMPIDLWVPATENVMPARSRQVTLGMAKDFMPLNTTFSIEGYYKKTDRMAGYREGASFILFDDPYNLEDGRSWEDNVTQGQGWSYGIEFLLHKKAGRFSGWAGYTLSWTQLQFDDVNWGRKFYARYDRRHDISLVGLFKASEKIHLSSTWVYGTGNAITMPNAAFQPFTPSEQSSRPTASYTSYYYYEDRNQFRMAPYHRLDLSIQFIKKLKGRKVRTWDLSVYNLYNRQNPYFYFLENTYSNTGNQTVLKQVSLFPIIPSITYNLKF
ncbi:TonB-dependent receptor [Cytophagaceae bacterium ABcell3]|nr:TonB-dependent receptor [Cytophagaceae bacterium ABcell3]